MLLVLLRIDHSLDKVFHHGRQSTWIPLSNIVKQDKVNSAVSEREDRVTGATRMADCDEMYWAAFVLCLAVLCATGMYWAVLCCTGLF